MVRPNKPAFNYRTTYDWDAYTPEGLKIAEEYWDQLVAFFQGFLPERYRTPSKDIRGLNLGTFNGAIQKAWMRAGYSMYGVELADVIEELHDYGCEGHKESFFDLSSIDAGSFDFAVVDRATCSKPFYLKFDVTGGRPPLKGEKRPNEGERLPMFDRMVRTIKPNGTLIGIFYPFYSYDIIRELASYGELTLWPLNTKCLAFQVDLSQPPADFPSKEVARKNFTYARPNGRESEVHSILTNEVIAPDGSALFPV